MNWKSAKFLLASTATVVVASQVAKKLYRYFFNTKKCYQADVITDDSCSELINIKNREINDVILFSDDVVRHTIRVPPNKDITICESRELNCFKLIKYIKSAKETLDVCMYLITSNEIAEQIIRLGQKHVLVRIVVDSDMANTPPSQIKKLKEYSFIQVQTNKKSILMHHKFCVVDGPRAIKRKNILKAYAEKLNVHAQYTPTCLQSQMKPKQVRGFVMSGSLNWSTQAMVSNHESVIVTSHPNIVGKFEKEFESLWMETESFFTGTGQDKEEDGSDWRKIDVDDTKLEIPTSSSSMRQAERDGGTVGNFIDFFKTHIIHTSDMMLNIGTVSYA